MKDFFKYLTVGEADKNWGLFLNVAGRASITQNAAYPLSEHPPGYLFDWKQGRVLQEYQLNYITEGSGILEDDFGTFKIKPGTMMIIHPGIKHRYRPTTKTGWVENYIGFKGVLANHFFQQSGFFTSPSVLQLNYREEIIEVYRKIYELVQREEPGFQQIASGLVIKLLGYMVAFQKQNDFKGKRIESLIRRARVYMQENIEKNIDLKEFAAEHFTAYSYFRKMFKKYTGIAPHQYHLELKIMRAKEMILKGNKSIKEISYELGFESIHYFSRLFKKKTDLNPTEWRKKFIGRLQQNDF